MDFLAVLGAIFGNLGVQLFLAGAAGGICRAVALKVRLWDAGSTILVGGFLGLFVSPVFVGAMTGFLTEWLHFAVDPDRLPAFTAFSVGVGGVAIIGFAIDWWRDWLKKLDRGSGVDPVTPKDGGPQ